MGCKKGRHRSPQNYNRLWPSASLSVEVVIYSQVSETLVPTHLYVYVYTKFISKICFFYKNTNSVFASNLQDFFSCNFTIWYTFFSGTLSPQYNTIQYNTIQYNTIQYNTIQYNTIHGLPCTLLDYGDDMTWRPRGVLSL